MWYNFPMNMETNKKSLLIFLVLIVVGGSAYGGFYFLKKYFTKQPIVNQNSSTSPEDVIPGFIRDASMKIPEVFPVKLILENDIAGIVESFSVSQAGKPTQHTFKYTSKKNLGDNVFYFMKYLSTNKWHIVGVPTTEKTFASFSSTRKIIENVFITINEVESVGVIVDVTYIK